ncbi:MAG TPA: signal recognition particle receptor subunit alpha, partial [Actinomycetota bacterium]|nr:signal recognition particle receptor subunit alpha [Actinomycetota bacterium]
MFDSLTGRFDDIFTRLRSRGRLSEKQVDEVLREIRLALLEADVSLKVVKAFVADVRQRAEGAEIHKSLTPAQQVIKLVHGALIDVIGHEAVGLEPSPRPPRVILMAGLQGSGKTTASGKLARHLKKSGRRPVLAACDLRRPAAISQLRILGEQVGVPVFSEEGTVDAPAVAARALAHARAEGYTDLIVDTAGRMHVDPDLMAELGSVSKEVSPTETLLVCDAMTGQDAVNVAEAVLEEVEVTG